MGHAGVTHLKFLRRKRRRSKKAGIDTADLKFEKVDTR